MSYRTLLAQIVPAIDVLVSKDEVAYASIDQSTNVQASWPQAVVRVNTQEQLIGVVRLCIDKRIPIVMRGAGTGKSGGAVGAPDSIVIDITRLNQIIAIDKQSLLAEVEPGVVLADLQEAVMKEGLFYPPDPASSSHCTIAGNVAENAAGPSTLKYGTTRNYLLGGQAIIGTGEIIDFGKRCPKGVAGYDIAALLCGSEGSLGIFTKFILRLLPMPQSFASGMMFFSDERQALRAVNVILTHGFLPKTLEYVDSVCLTALARVEGSLALPNQKAAALIIECDAHAQGAADSELAALCALIKDHGMVSATIARDATARSELWLWRSRLSEACSHFRGHKISEDIAVPLGALSEFVVRVKSLASMHRHLSIGLFGHAGDGNLHVQIMFDDPSEMSVAQMVRHEILVLVLELNGTIAAEHGIGLQKKAYLPLEQSSALIELQKRIKAAFDPHGLLNPGKIFE